VNVRNGRNLTINERRGPTERFEPRSLFTVPRRRGLVVRQDRKRASYDVAEVSVKSVPPFALRETTAAVREFVPDG